VTITPSAFGYVSDLVRQYAAIVIGPGKEYLVESRLMPLARDAGLEDVSSLVARLQLSQDDRLRRQVVEAMTTNETSFFRDRDPFTAFTQVVLPDLCRKRGANRRITVWSAACSTGQEPYSIAMSAVDHPLITSDWTVEILATDINEEILDRARSGRYSQLEVNRGLPASLLVRHFERCETDWRVVNPVRDMVRFKALNLNEPFDLPFMDVVFLRNVLIYFDAATKAAVLQRVRRVLKPDGYLFLGGSETTIGLDDGFERVVLGTATAYRPRGAGPVEMPTMPTTAAGSGLAGLAGLGGRTLPAASGARAAPGLPVVPGRAAAGNAPGQQVPAAGPPPRSPAWPWPPSGPPTRPLN
jgi:chemotaxis protein methyltransferase CheR